jgi:hypothetical protein
MFFITRTLFYTVGQRKFRKITIKLSFVQKLKLFLFFRWWDTSLWSDFFNQFLNIKSDLPNVTAMRTRFEEAFFKLQARNCFMTAAAELNKLMISK